MLNPPMAASRLSYAARIGSDFQQLIIGGLAGQLDQLPHFPLETNLRRLLTAARDDELPASRESCRRARSRGVHGCGPGAGGCLVCSRSSAGGLLRNFQRGQKTVQLGAVFRFHLNELYAHALARGGIAHDSAPANLSGGQVED
jgi:hypothetical protein